MMYEGEEMVDRRSVLKLGAASIAGTLISMPAPALGAAWADSPNPLYRAVFDGRFEEGLAFADELQRRRVVTFSTRHDIAKLWYGDGRARQAFRRKGASGYICSKANGPVLSCKQIGSGFVGDRLESNLKGNSNGSTT
jgi:hypothetical protein